MKITYIRLFKRKDEDLLMKHLRNSENEKWNKEHKEKNIHSKKTINNSIYKEWKGKLKQKLNTQTIIKKNQVVLVATSLMLVTAGYLNYTNNIKIASIGDAQLVSTNIMDEETHNENQNEKVNDETADTSSNYEENNSYSVDNEEQEENKELLDEKQELKTIETSSKNEGSDYFAKTKLERETMYSQMLDTYQKILENGSIPNDQKSIASNEIKNINDKKTAISTIENLIKIKGLKDVVLLINDNNINIVVKSDKNLETNQVAQIQNIIARELKADIEDIHITTHQ